VRAAVRESLPEVCDAIEAGEALAERDRNRMLEAARLALREGRG
jgi:hypothetical protein